MWVIELRIIQLMGDLLSQLESGRKIAGDEQVTLPENSSQAQRTTCPKLTTLQDRKVWLMCEGLPMVTRTTCALGTHRPSFNSKDVLLNPRCPHLPQEVIFMVPNGNVLVLSRIGDDFNKPSDLGLGIQGHAKEL